MNVIDWGPILWVLNVALLFAVALQVRLYVHARRRRRTGDGREFLRSAVSQLHSGSATEVARTAIEGALIESSAVLHRLPSTFVPERTIMVLARASGDWVDAVRRTVNPRINEFNSFCELIEEGILRPIDLVRESPQLHRELIEELSLLEPFIWYQAILGGRGRWGFRALQLLEALARLRAVSPDSDLRRDMEITVDEYVVRIWPSVSTLQHWLELAGSAFRPHTLSVRSKVRQNKQRERLTDSLKKLAPDLPFPPPSAHKTVEW